jgi:DNA-3-methyladenine glycosylase I
MMMDLESRKNAEITKYKNIFNAVLETIIKNSIYSRDKVLSRFEPFKHFDFELFDDRCLYQALAYIPFYAGLKSKTVTNKVGTIKAYFSDYEPVARYNESDVRRMLADPRMLRHPSKIKAAIANAKTVSELVKHYGSFKDYLRSLNFNRSQEDLEKAAMILKKTFSYLGDATVHHFLTDIGAKTIKPDRVIMRVLTQLKLVPDQNALETARLVCNSFVEATGYSHRYVDIVMVKLGHIEDDIDIGLPQGICLENGPRCGKCLVTKYCFYGR